MEINKAVIYRVQNTHQGQKMNTSLTSLAVVTAVNDDEVLAANLAKSPMIYEDGVPLIIECGHKSATLAYNAGLEKTTADVVIFAHQDVYLPRGWKHKLLSTIEGLELKGKKWGVLGVVGKDRTGNLVGGVWSTGLQRKIESKFSSPAPARSFDEIVIILRKNSGLRFDDDLPGFHLYGTDIVLTALKAGLGTYVFDAPVVHNSLWIKKLGFSYCAAYRYMQHKWRQELPIKTLVLPITCSSWPLLRNWCHEKKKWLVRQFKPRRPRVRHEDPLHLAQKLGYECAD